MSDDSRQPKRSPDLVQRWKTDVAPVHERTERSREFRNQYLQIALKSLLLSNAGALVALPVIGELIGTPFAENMALFLFSEGSFFVGLLLALTATLFALIMLDADVVRQKGERAAARGRLIATGFAELPGDSMEAERVSSEKHQARYWRIGVGLMWTTVAILALATVAFLTGGILAGRVLSTAAG